MGIARAACAFASCLCFATSAHAADTQRRDYMLDPPAAGLFANLDAFTLGAQASLEHRLELDGDITMLTTRVSALGSLGYGEVGAHADVRAALLTLGGSVGYRDVFRNYAVGPGEANTRALRRAADADKTRTHASWPWAEGRARLVIPLESLWLVSSYALRWEDADAGSFDWFHANVHDGGALHRVDTTLFYRHKDFGGLGPTIRYMSLPRTAASGAHTREGELAFGLTFLTRPGLRKRDDLLLFQVLTVPRDQEFGFHVLSAPVYAMLVYRAAFALHRPDRGW